MAVDDDYQRWFVQFRDSGDRSALEQLFRHAARPMFQRALAQLRDAAAAEDAVQEAFVVVLRKIEEEEVTRGFRSYLFGILDNKVHHVRRHLHRGASTDESPDPAVEDAADRAITDAEVREHIERALVDLPDRYRKVLELHLLQNMASPEISAKLDRPQATIRTQLHRGLQLLRDKLPRGLASLLAVGVSSALLRADSGASADPTSVTSRTGFKLGLAAVAVLVIAAAALYFTDVFGTDTPPGERKDTANTGRTTAQETPTENEKPVDDRTEVDPKPQRGAVRARLTWKDDGKPAVGLSVIIQRRLGRENDFVGVRCTPDENGMIELDDLPIGAGRLVLDGGLTKKLDLRPDPETHELQVPPAQSINGLVLDADGRPVAGAAIWMSWYLHWGGVNRIATTDAEGRFRVRGLQTGASFGAYHPDHGPSVEHVVGATHEQDAVLRMGREAFTLRGRVTDKAGNAIAGAVLHAGEMPRIAQQGPANTMGKSCTAQRTVSGDDGSFVFEGLPPSGCDVLVRAADFAPTQVRVRGGTGSVLEQTIQLRAGRRLRGIVRDAEGKPLAWAGVSIAGEKVHEWASAEADTGGRFELVAVNPDRISVRIIDAAHAMLERVFTASDPAPEFWEVQLERPPYAKGYLVSHDGKRVGDATWRVWILDRNRHRSGIPQPWPVDDRGTVGLHEYRDGHEIYVSSSKQTTWVRCTARPGEDGALEIVVPEAFEQRGKIVGTLGGLDPAIVADGFPVLHTDGLYYGPKFALDRTTGAFTIEPIVPGEYDVHWRGLRGAFPSMHLGRHKVTADAPVDLGVVEVQHGTLRYRLSLPNGAPPPAEQVHAYAAQPGFYVPFAGVEGKWTLRAGTYDVGTQGAGFVSTKREGVVIRPGAETIVSLKVQSGPTVRISFRVETTVRKTDIVLRRRNGEVLTDSKVILEPDGSGFVPIVLNEGYYDLEVKAAGKTWTGMVYVPRGVTGLFEVPVPLTPKR